MRMTINAAAERVMPAKRELKRLEAVGGDRTERLIT
jgi:hypothetical protein